MKKNISSSDKIIRLIIAIIITTLSLTHVITGTLVIILLIIACILLLTSIIRFCPIYKLFGISTYCKKNNK